LIPIEAIAENTDGESIAWVLNAENVVAPRRVKLGAAIGGRVEVVQGLEPGERVIVAGVRFLRDGMQVRDLGDALGEPS
jgi:multidrug efflux pump subunit AcrA (membrane-fusion protein)